MHRGAFTHAFKVVCGFEDASIDEVEHHGMTVCVHLPTCMRVLKELWTKERAP
jgi:hypothetical protein